MYEIFFVGRRTTVGSRGIRDPSGLNSVSLPLESTYNLAEFRSAEQRECCVHCESPTLLEVCENLILRLLHNNISINV